MTRDGQRTVRLAELIGALSLATDIGMGQPMEQAINTCLLSVKTARLLGMSGDDLSDVYYLALLRFVGCTADAHQNALEVGGDEIAFRAGVAPVIMGDTPEFMRFMITSFAADQPRLSRLRLLAAAMLDGTKGAKRTIAEHCEVAQMLVARMGLRREVGVYVGNVFERWDGKGLPGDLAGDAIPAPARVVAAARDVEVFHRLGGWAMAAEVLRRRRGGAYDPAVADVLLEHGEASCREAGEASAWEAMLAVEPGPPLTVPEGGIEHVLQAFADFVDLKSPYTLGHSSGTATLAETAANAMGLEAAEVTAVRRAGLVHDLGKAGVPNGIWDRKGPLSRSEWERVRLHPYLTERMLSAAPALSPLAGLAGAHHERLDGSGYHKGLTGGALTPAARLLAAADAYQAMTQERPHRPALAATAREQELRGEAAAGRLDAQAVRCVLEAAGHAVTSPRRAWPGGLTEREVEVLRLLCRGASNREVARALTLSVKTVGRHVENIYDKIGVSSRAAAALFAMEHAILQP